MLLIDNIVRRVKKAPIHAWRAVTKKREALQKLTQKRSGGKKVQRLSPTTVYEYCKGATHRRGRQEKRGRPATLTKTDVQKLMRTP